MELTGIRWLRRALLNLDEIATFIAQDNPDRAGTFVGEIIREIELLVHQPSLGRPGRVSGTRELIVAGGRYIVPYRVKRNQVEILRVMHHARRWPNRFAGG